MFKSFQIWNDNQIKSEFINQLSTNKEINSPITTNDKTIISDYDGSYTGVPVDDKFSKPVHDVDDL